MWCKSYQLDENSKNTIETVCAIQFSLSNMVFPFFFLSKKSFLLSIIYFTYCFHEVNLEPNCGMKIQNFINLVSNLSFVSHLCPLLGRKM